MIDWLTKRISKNESLDNNKEVKQSKQQEQELGREKAHDYIRKNDGRIHYIDDDYYKAATTPIYLCKCNKRPFLIFGVFTQ
jgi:hypothetical protein